MALERELQVALEAAELAGGKILAEYEVFEAIPNAPASISTDADRASQELILQHIHAAFPDDALCAEENTPTLRSAVRSGSRLWVVDPIDGTRGFAQKNGEFSVMIALAVEGRSVLGVVLEPVQRRVTYAVRGGGCWAKVGGEPARECTVSEVSDLAQATLVQSRSKTPEPSRPARLLMPKRVKETHSAGVKLALVARGEAELYVNTYTNFHDWDICAGQILVEEAGGRVTDLRGNEVVYAKPGHSQRGGLLATNGRLHDEALTRLIEGT